MQDFKESMLLHLARSLRKNEQTYHWTVVSFRWLQRAGISVSPNHFYWPVPDVEQLETRQWAGSAMCGIDLRMERQLRFLESVVPRYQAELNFPDARNGVAGYHRNNGYFESVDAEIAYCMVRHFQPRRIIEIGAGYTTLLFEAALRRNSESGGRRGELVTIDPDEHKLDSFSRSTTASTIAMQVQEVNWSVFATLGENDILFLDSSHVVGVGSDVVYEYLEILPRLNRGVLVHAHDIFLPADYPREAVLNHLCFWSEQYLLQAFLTYNPNFEVVWGSSTMLIYHREALEEAFPSWRTSYRNMPLEARRFVPSMDQQRVWPSSFWFRRK
jgi:predicted O-methyltransferase YrrM